MGRACLWGSPVFILGQFPFSRLTQIFSSSSLVSQLIMNNRRLISSCGCIERAAGCSRNGIRRRIFSLVLISISISMFAQQLSKQTHLSSFPAMQTA
uniref:Uncharacterized protein n=1 Tax=Rhizophora mucronata TaxID=61149 RepID=A0A2P2QR38_RHIMU